MKTRYLSARGIMSSKGLGRVLGRAHKDANATRFICIFALSPDLLDALAALPISTSHESIIDDSVE